MESALGLPYIGRQRAGMPPPYGLCTPTSPKVEGLNTVTALKIVNKRIKGFEKNSYYPISQKLHTVSHFTNFKSAFFSKIIELLYNVPLKIAEKPASSSMRMNTPAL